MAGDAVRRRRVGPRGSRFRPSAGHRAVSRDSRLRGLIEELRTGSTEFESLWSVGAVGSHREDHKVVHHPTVGPITVDCDVLTDGDAELKIVIMTAAPDRKTKRNSGWPPFPGPSTSCGCQCSSGQSSASATALLSDDAAEELDPEPVVLLGPLRARGHERMREGRLVLAVQIQAIGNAHSVQLRAQFGRLIGNVPVFPSAMKLGGKSEVAFFVTFARASQSASVVSR